MKTRVVLLALVAAALVVGCTSSAFISSSGRATVKVERPGGEPYDTLVIQHDWEQMADVDLYLYIYGSTIKPIVLQGLGVSVDVQLSVGDLVPIGIMYQNPKTGKFWHGQYNYLVPSPDEMEFHQLWIDRQFVQSKVNRPGRWHGFNR